MLIPVITSVCKQAPCLLTQITAVAVRGNAKTEIEIGLIAIAYNLKKKAA